MEWRELPLMIEDHTCVDMDYKGDPKLPRALGQAWGPDGMYAFVFIVVFTSLTQVRAILLHDIGTNDLS